MKITHVTRYFWLASILGVIVIFSQLSHAQYTITDFNYKTDMPEVNSIIKAEWNKLFYMPQYDLFLITSMFKLGHPGDTTQQDKKLQVKVLREGKQIVGFVTYYFANPQTGHIELLAINEKFQGHGYGKKMVDWVAKECVNHGAHILQLYVYPTNPHAIQFYEHIGFVIKIKYPAYLLLQKQLG